MPAPTRSGFMAIAAALPLVAALAAQTVDVDSLGPKAGERVPDFSLPDQHGNSRTLRSTFGPKGAVLVFFRSADW
jgi:hypothetical protein